MLLLLLDEDHGHFKAHHATYRVNAKSAADELDYADIIVLAETFVCWAIEDPDITPPHHRTTLIEAGVDYERLA